jgi:hypothetical protein
VGQRAYSVFAANQKHRHSPGIRTLHLAFSKLSVGQYRHELFRHLLGRSMIHSDLLAEDKMATQVS